MDFDFKAYVERAKSQNRDVVEDMPRNKYKRYNPGKQSKGRKIRSTIQKVTSIAREVLDIYVAVKRKDPISISLGVLSGYGVVSKMFEREREKTTDMLREMGAKLIFPMMSQFIYLTLKQIDIPSKKFWEESDGGDCGGDEVPKSSESQQKIESFDLGGIQAFFSVPENDEQYNGIRGPWVLDEDGFVKEFSSLIRDKLGDAMAINTIAKGWDYVPFLASLDLGSDVFVSPIDEDEFLRCIKQFYEMGINRSILFFGPPGVGKTTLAARISKKMNGKLLVITHRGLNNLRFSSLVDIIEIVDPAVVLFDDMDRLWKPENMLNEMEQLNRQVRSKNRLIIATVNDLESIPEALRRPGRFDEIIEFSPPKKGLRRKILEAYAEQLKIALNETQMDELVQLTDGMTGAYLKEVIRRTSVIGFDRMPKQLVRMRKVADMPNLKKKGSKKKAAKYKGQSSKPVEASNG